MKTRDEIVAMIEAADIKQDDWADLIIESIDDPYARGYITGYMTRFNGALSFREEDYRRELLDVCGDLLWTR